MIYQPSTYDFTRVARSRYGLESIEANILSLCDKLIGFWLAQDRLNRM